MTAKQYCSFKFEERLNQVMIAHYKERGLPPPTRESVASRKSANGGVAVAINGNGVEIAVVNGQQQQQQQRGSATGGANGGQRGSHPQVKVVYANASPAQSAVGTSTIQVSVHQ
jgi:hypothetical protein